MIQPGSMLDRYVRLTLQVAGDANPQDAEMKQPQLIPKRRKRKRQPTASMYRDQLRLAADEIIRLRTERDWMNRHMVAGAWRFPIGIPGEARPPLWRRLWNRLRVRVVETDPETAAAMPPMEE